MHRKNEPMSNLRGQISLLLGRFVLFMPFLLFLCCATQKQVARVSSDLAGVSGDLSALKAEVGKIAQSAEALRESNAQLKEALRLLRIQVETEGKQSQEALTAQSEVINKRLVCTSAILLQIMSTNRAQLAETAAAAQRLVDVLRTGKAKQVAATPQSSPAVYDLSEYCADIKVLKTQ